MILSYLIPSDIIKYRHRENIISISALEQSKYHIHWALKVASRLLEILGFKCSDYDRRVI